MNLFIFINRRIITTGIKIKSPAICVPNEYILNEYIKTYRETELFGGTNTISSHLNEIFNHDI